MSLSKSQGVLLHHIFRWYRQSINCGTTQLHPLPPCADIHTFSELICAPNFHYFGSKYARVSHFILLLSILHSNLLVHSRSTKYYLFLTFLGASHFFQTLIMCMAVHKYSDSICMLVVQTLCAPVQILEITHCRLVQTDPLSTCHKFNLMLANKSEPPLFEAMLKSTGLSVREPTSFLTLTFIQLTFQVRKLFPSWVLIRVWYVTAFLFHLVYSRNLMECATSHRW